MLKKNFQPDPCVFGVTIPGNIPVKTKKPPLGLRPAVAWIDARRNEIEAAIERYEKAGMRVPSEWHAQLSQLTPLDGKGVRIIVEAIS
jgi:hypothetical protein